MFTRSVFFCFFGFFLGEGEGWGTEALGEKTCRYENHRVLAQLYLPKVGEKNVWI